MREQTKKYIAIRLIVYSLSFCICSCIKTLSSKVNSVKEVSFLSTGVYITAISLSVNLFSSSRLLLASVIDISPLL
jgi:hypothetical protein